MTFQLNRLQLLNGSKLHILLLISWLAIGCASTGPSSGRPMVIDPDKKKEEAKEDEAKIPVDTVLWTVVSEEEFPPITDMETNIESFMSGAPKKQHYKVALMLPFRMDESGGLPELSTNNLKFADFYSGFKLASDAVEGVNISVKTYYTNRDIDELDKILRDFSYEQPDVIIGSYESEILSKTAEWARDNRVPLISPWLSSTKITENNLFYLQLRPSITNYYEKILEHVNNNFEKRSVYVITRESGRDQRMSRILHKLNEDISDVPLASAYQDLVVPMSSLMQEDSIFAEVLESGAEAFILPHYASRDESYVYSCLRKLYAEKGEQEFYIYTMPLMLTSDRIDINLLKNLKTRTCEFRFPDLRNYEVQNFRENYYNRYGGLPSEDSYYGYDLMQFVAIGLREYGQYFHYYMADEPLDLLQMKIHIQPYRKNADDERPTFMANEHLYLIEYDKDHFVVKDIR